MRCTGCKSFAAGAFCAAIACLSAVAVAEPIVPGTGVRLTNVGDDFEDPAWEYVPNNPKSSFDIDERNRLPAGFSRNGRWVENVDRGHPEVVRRVDTPEGGLPGSSGALMLASKATGVPGKLTRTHAQDDLILNVYSRVNGYVPVSQGPSIVVRIYLPPIEQWEARTGSTFALRATVRGAKSGEESEAYWPGIFINHKVERDRADDSAWLLVRANGRGGDFRAAEIGQTGWWTFGMSFSPDGQVHYYAKPGIEDLTSSDHLGSQYPYGFRTQKLREFFFDVFGPNDDQTWSTAWIIDDPQVFLAYPPRQDQARQPTNGRRRSSK